MKLNLKVLMFALFISAPSIASAQNFTIPKSCADIYNESVTNINVSYLNCLDSYDNQCADVSVCLGPSCDEILDSCYIVISVCESRRQVDLAEAYSKKTECERRIPRRSGGYVNPRNLHLSLDTSIDIDI